MKRVPLSLVLLTPLFVGSFLPKACACSCVVGATEEEQRAQADVVFVGVAVSRHDPNPEYQNSPEDPSRQGDQIEWTFDVEQVEKGTSGQTESVRTSRSSSMCGFSFEEGSRYRVFAHRQEDQRLSTSYCSGTRKMSVGETSTPSPAASKSPSPPSSPPPSIPSSPLVQEPSMEAALLESSEVTESPTAEKRLGLSQRAQRSWLKISALVSLSLTTILLLLTFAWLRRFPAQSRSSQ